jgi:hypothetical protein
VAPFSVFISYRRNDTPAEAGVLYDALANRYGEANVFMDVELEPGMRFEDVIMERVHRCDVLIALIGPTWLTAADENGRRLDQPDDLVRREIVAALERGATVIPVLAGDVPMPKSSELPDDLKVLTGIHSFDLALRRDYRTERERLIRYVDKIRDSRPGFMTSSLAGLGGDHRRPLQAAIVVGVIIAAILVGVGIASRGGGGTSTASSDGGGGGMSGLDSIEVELMKAHVPGRIEETCHHIRAIDDQTFLRSIDCSQGRAGESVVYSRAHSGSALRTYFEATVSAKGLDKQAPTRRSCRTATGSGDKAWGGWSRRLTQTHVERAKGLAEEGRVLCFQAGGSAWMVWTDKPTKMYVSASRPISERFQLYEWWRTQAGPQKQHPMQGPSMEAEPWGADAIENVLLLGHIPVARTACRRSPLDYDHLIFLRAVTCRPKAQPKVEYLYAHSGSALINYAKNQRSEVAGMSRDDGKCFVDVVAASPWRRVHSTGHAETTNRHNSEGRVLCSMDPNGDATIEWSDNTTGIYAEASVPYADRKQLYAWWKTQAGPGTEEDMGTGGGQGESATTTTTSTGGMHG